MKNTPYLTIVKRAYHSEKKLLTELSKKVLDIHTLIPLLTSRARFLL